MARAEVLGLSFGLGAVALTQAAVYRVDPDQTGIAAALLNTAQQIGVAVGLAPPRRRAWAIWLAAYSGAEEGGLSSAARSLSGS